MSMKGAAKTLGLFFLLGVRHWPGTGIWDRHHTATTATFSTRRKMVCRFQEAHIRTCW